MNPETLQQQIETLLREQVKRLTDELEQQRRWNKVLRARLEELEVQKRPGLLERMRIRLKRKEEIEDD